MKNERRLLLILVANIIIMAWISRRFILVPPQPVFQNDRLQFAVICCDPGGSWEILRQGIDQAAAERNVAVEYIVSAFFGSGADEDSIRMAVESRVDGIAVFQTSGDVGAAIDYAEEQGVPVVTMAYDEPESLFDVFVGVKSAAYSHRLLETLERFRPEALEVGLIYGEDIQPELVETVEAALDRRYRLWTAGRASPHIFDASETVARLFTDSEGRLEVICCLDDNTTQGVAQVVVDWNMVNQLSIVATGSSETVLPMVEKGYVSAAILTDYERIGRDAVFALSDICQGAPLTDGGDNLRVVIRGEAAVEEQDYVA